MKTSKFQATITELLEYKSEKFAKVQEHDHYPGGGDVVEGGLKTLIFPIAPPNFSYFKPL